MLPKNLSDEQKKVKELCKIWFLKLGFPVNIGLAQICAESRFNIGAVSPVGAGGVAQFMPATFYEVKNELALKGVIIESQYNVRDACIAYVYYMTVSIPRQLKNKKVVITWENLFRSYNAGSGNVIKSRMFAETNDYVKRINLYRSLIQ